MAKRKTSFLKLATATERPDVVKQGYLRKRVLLSRASVLRRVVHSGSNVVTESILTCPFREIAAKSVRQGEMSETWENIISKTALLWRMFPERSSE